MSLVTKIIYGVLFLALLIHPHVITEHVFSVPRSYIQSLVTILLLGIGLSIYIVHRRDITKREMQKKEVKAKLDMSSKNLTDAFKYIGLVNRRLPLLHEMTTGLVSRSEPTKNGRKNIFDELLSTVCVSIAKVEWGMFRFVDNTTHRTTREFVYIAEGYDSTIPAIPNSALLNAGGTAPKSASEKINIWETSDVSAQVKCFLVFPKSRRNTKDDHTVLQALCDQAQLFYGYMY